MTLRDSARFAEFIAGGGKINGRSILPDGWLAQATSNQIKPPAHGSYGYFWWVRPDGFRALGIFGQGIVFFPQDHLIIVVNGAALKATSADVNTSAGALIDAVEGATR